MKLVSEEGTRKFDFGMDTIIHSSDNSVGKSTILRLLFYGLGYPIPGTYKMKFKKIKIYINFSNKNGEFQTYRKGDYLELRRNGKIIHSAYSREDLTPWLTLIWNITSPEVLNNLLGAIYMDQDKGWTLLNRGKVIGNISFNVRDLLIGLSSTSDKLSKIIIELKELKKLREKTNQLILLNEVVDYSENTENNDEKISERQVQYKNLKVKMNYLKHKIQGLQRQISQQEGLKNYLYGLHLIIKDSKGNNIFVSKEKKNLVSFEDNISFLKMQLTFLKIDLNKVQKDFHKIDLAIDKETENLFSSQDVVKNTVSALSNIKIDVQSISNRRDELDKNIRDLNDQLNALFMKDNPLIEETQNWIFKFAKELNVYDVVNSRKEYLFTRDLKSISGTIYYKVVFSFKMAYIKIIEKVTGVKLPIVLDSPSGREVTERNINAVIGILNEYFENNQVIIASINSYNLKKATYIELGERIFDYKYTE